MSVLLQASSVYIHANGYAAVSFGIVATQPPRAREEQAGPRRQAGEGRRTMEAGGREEGAEEGALVSPALQGGVLPSSFLGEGASKRSCLRQEAMLTICSIFGIDNR